MPEQVPPGTYVEETSFSARRIEPVPTSVTALLGTCADGPDNEPVAVESLNDFDQVYPSANGSPLRQALADFLSHGGHRALTVRVTDGPAALASLAEHDWQLLVAVPGVVDLSEAHSLCRRHRAFLVCDATSDGDLPAGLGSNAAAYFPPLADPSGSRPCAPAVAGVLARHDATYGVWKAPAGTGSALKVPLARELSPGQIDVLRAGKVNALRTLVPFGVVIWGNRTASSDPEWKYVPVRRLLLFLEHSVDRGLQWAVFEPNGEPLWAQARQVVSNFLFDLWRQGALVGTTAEKSYFVRCDRSTMSQVDIDAGRLVVLVGVAALAPAEFVIFRIEVQTGVTA